MPVKSNVRKSVSVQHAVASSSASVNLLFCQQEAAKVCTWRLFSWIFRYRRYASKGKIPGSAPLAALATKGCLREHNCPSQPKTAGPVLKFRLFRRRLTISSPRMSVRNSLPWPLRWIAGALMLGFSAAIALWAFEFGREIAGLDGDAKQELSQLRQEVVSLRAERDKAQSIANTSGSLLTADKATLEKLLSQIKQLESDNRGLRDDLGFFERLLPASSTEVATIRSLQAEVLSETQLKWQVLVILPVKNAPTFNGKLDLTLHGTQGGRPWTMSLPGGPQPLQFKQYRRMEGVLDLPPQAVVKTVTAKVMEGAAVRSVQTFKL
jgi:hypothetical protein